MTQLKHHQRPVILKRLIVSILLLLLCSVGLVVFLDQDLEQRKPVEPVVQPPWYPVEPARLISPFTLQGEGGLVGSDVLHGKWTLLTLGFTHCMESCPMALHTVWTLFEEQQLKHATHAPIQSWFVSIDPQRDSLSRLQDYMLRYPLPVGAPTIRPLRGELPQLRRLSALLGAEFRYPQWRSGAEYPVEHTPDIYLINPAGYLVARFPQPFSTSALSAGLQAFGWQISTPDHGVRPNDHKM
ncbi:SCO family protein [Magnetococcus sp. PR-3]|uniref:SCO family protein n=1 Tax=Magnetococcus sp. PR-3 TaxID=3120355 RepID=UPI002FCDF1A8